MKEYCVTFYQVSHSVLPSSNRFQVFMTGTTIILFWCNGYLCHLINLKTSTYTLKPKNQNDHVLLGQDSLVHLLQKEVICVCLSVFSFVCLQKCQQNSQQCTEKQHQQNVPRRSTQSGSMRLQLSFKSCRFSSLLFPQTLLLKYQESWKQKRSKVKCQVENSP